MKDNYDLFPNKRILPYNGMSITARVWSDAHEYHSNLLNAHQYFVHGTGIVTGLEVIASDPPENIVYILPGAAIDSAGRLVVVAEPIAYDLGTKMEGDLRILLAHREIKSQAVEEGDSNAPAYMQDEFIIVARTEPLDAPHIELARVFRENTKKPVTDADNPDAPGSNAIDMRFREDVSPPPPEQILTGVTYLGSVKIKFYDRALAQFKKVLKTASPYRLIVEHDVPLDDGIAKYDFVVLVVDGEAKLDKNQTDALLNFLKEEGKLWIEFTSEVAEEAILEFCKPLKAKVTKATASHDLFQDPHLFITPPPGSVQEKGAEVYAGEGVVCTPACYGGIWSGSVKKALFTREVIRSTIEWGENIVKYLLAG